MIQAILVINSGSSSIKFSIFTANADLDLLYHGVIDNIFEAPSLTILDASHTRIFIQNISATGHAAGLRLLFNWLEQLKQITLKAAGHRVVHGGKIFLQPTLITTTVMQKIARLSPLAPLHQPYNLEAIKSIETIYPKLPQVACFDTTFHHTQNKLATLFAIPEALSKDDIIRYGFHGISYEYIASIITQQIGEAGNRKVIMAHLGNGSSMCAMHQGKSIATSMGFTALDGLVMGSRCGQIDPGVLLYLLEEKSYSIKQLEHMLYNESGLLGVSGISNDMRELLLSSDTKALEAVDLFCYRAALEFGSLATALGGCDALIFTAGIGENAATVRKKICEYLHWLGITLDENANKANSTLVSAKDSRILVAVIPTNEEYMIAKHAIHLIFNL